MNSGELVAHLSVATSESWKNKSTGARRDATEWHRVVLYKRLAELAAHHLKKRRVNLLGRPSANPQMGR
jgi:single-strand DNA-binding protein